MTGAPLQNANDIEALKFFIAAGVGETIPESPAGFAGGILENTRAFAEADCAPAQADPAELTPVKEAAAAAAKLAEAAQSIEELKAAIESFGLCPSLSRTASHAVFGAGAARPKLLIITEAPTRDEDLSGEALSGAGGETLRKIIEALSRSLDKDAHVMPALPWRPAGGRPPTNEEAEILRPFARRFVELLSPEMIMTMGAAPLLVLFGRTEALAGQHGKWLRFAETPLMPVHSLAMIMSSAEAKRAAWADMQLVLNPPGESNVSE